MSDLWIWPLPGYTESSITSGVGPRWGSSHKGIDIGASRGARIVATRSGTVTRASITCSHNYGKQVGQDTCGGGYGNYIYIDHGDGYTSRYAHLTNISVKVGDKVSGGQMIGTVGSTGNSTGNHLHFEIRLNDRPVDPEQYVSSSGPSAVSPDYDDTSYSEDIDLPDGYYGTVEAGGTTIGQRVSGVTTQPVHAFVNIYVGDNQLLLATTPARPNVIQSFEYTRLEGAGESAIFTVFDRNWEEIEAALSANFDNINIEYGYYGTGVKSKLVRHRLLSYNLSFEFEGPIISVETTTEGVVGNLVPRSILLDTYNPTEAVKKICKTLRYEVLDENFDSSQDISADNPFNIVEDFPITYINSVIIPQASQENEELFRFFVDNENRAYFKRISYTTTKTDSLRTYIYQKGYDSSVIDFNVDIKGVFGGTGDFELATGYRSSVFDTTNKEQVSQKVDKSSVITEATGDTTHTDSNQSVPVIDSSGRSASQMKNILYYNMKSRVHDAYEATLTIVGDPTIDYINDRYIRIINVTDKGYLHHTSGVYWIQGVTDSIQGGEMTTTLKLMKNATAGDIDGIEIINPKYLIK